MSDTPQGGWWKAKDGKWYPPETHPDRVRADAGGIAAGPPAAGWWQANDGNWYPPETHPDLRTSDPAAAPQDAVAERSDDARAADQLDQPMVPPVDQPLVPPVDQPLVPPVDQSMVPPVDQQPPTLADPAATLAPSGWGGFGATPSAEPSSTWGSIDTVDETTVSRGAPAPAPAPAASVPSPAVEEEEGAPLPGWRRGSDGAWYPPGQALPGGGAAATSSTSASESAGASGADTRSAGAATTADDGSSRRRVLIVLGAVAALVVLVVAGILLFGGDDSGQDDTAGPTTTEDAPATSAPGTSAPTTSGPPTTASEAPSEPPGQVSGTGTAVVGVGRTVEEPLLALATHDGPGAFVLSFVGPDGAIVQQPMGPGVEGTYLGVLPVNFVADQPFDAVRVEGEGPWAVTFAVVDSAPVLPTTPGAVFEGRGDAVLKVSAAADVQVALTCSGCGDPLTVVAYDGSGGSGSVLRGRLEAITVPAGTQFLQVSARPAPGGESPTWTMRPA